MTKTKRGGALDKACGDPKTSMVDTYAVEPVPEKAYFLLRFLMSKEEASHQKTLKHSQMPLSK
jgi:hypothetical protein